MKNTAHAVEEVNDNKILTFRSNFLKRRQVYDFENAINDSLFISFLLMALRAINKEGKESESFPRSRKLLPGGRESSFSLVFFFLKAKIVRST